MFMLPYGARKIDEIFYCSMKALERAAAHSLPAQPIVHN